MSKIILTFIAAESFQTDVKEIIEQILDGEKPTMIMCLNSPPDHLLRQLDVMVQEKVANNKKLFFLDCVSNQELKFGNTIHLGYGVSPERMLIETKEALQSKKPAYFILDSLDSLIGDDTSPELMQQMINALNQFSINSLIFVGADKEKEKLVKDVQRRVTETKYYNKVKREAAEWSEY